VRQELGIRTLMNVLGPMTNPAGAKRQVIGVFSPDWQLRLAEVLKLLGAEHVLIVHSPLLKRKSPRGKDRDTEGKGLDEISLDGPTQIVELKAGQITEYQIKPSDFGIDERSTESLEADSPESSLTLLEQSLTEPDSAAADIVSLNAGAAIYVSGVATSLANGVIMAQDAIAAGLANERLQELVRITSLIAEQNAEQTAEQANQHDEGEQ
jgi:anthranilate phosphoribosyltransferase